MIISELKDKKGNMIKVTDEVIKKDDKVVMLDGEHILSDDRGVFIMGKVHHIYKKGKRVIVFYRGRKMDTEANKIYKIYKCERCGKLKNVSYDDDCKSHICKNCISERRSVGDMIGYRKDNTIRDAFEDLRKKLHLTHKEMWRRFPCFAKEINNEELRNLTAGHTKFLNLAMMEIDKEKKEQK